MNNQSALHLRKRDLKGMIGMTREEAYAVCPLDSYVEFYGGQWLVIPLAPVEQPSFFTCLPRSRRGTNRLIRRPA
jgi:hypothetical protein